MEAIRRFIDWAGPAVYVVMVVLAVYLVSEAGWENISLDLSSGESLGFAESIPVMLGAIALVVSYFSGPMLNFGDFSRYGRSFEAVKRGNLLGLPVNFLFFSILTVITASATVPVFGELITDPIHTVERIDTPFAILLGGLTFVIATIGINIVANFISPAFDFSNVAPQKISWRTGGMIAAVGSVLLTPWNWYGNPDAIHYTLGVLGALIGPLFGILIAGYYVISRQFVDVDAMFTMSPGGRYYFSKGYNPNAIYAILASGIPAILSVIVPKLIGSGLWIADYSWFIGCGLGFVAFIAFERRNPGSWWTPVIHVKVINPNTSRDMTETIGACAREVADHVTAVSPAMGPASIESHYDEALAVPGILTELHGADAYVIACFGDPGLDAAREVADGPVIGIAEAAMHVATLVSRGFSVVTTPGPDRPARLGPGRTLRLRGRPAGRARVRDPGAGPRRQGVRPRRGGGRSGAARRTVRRRSCWGAPGWGRTRRRSRAGSTPR